MKKYVKDIRSKPLYDSTTGKLLGWELSWNYVEPEFGCLEIRIPASRFFEQTWFRNSYRAMCRFKSGMLASVNQNNSK